MKKVKSKLKLKVAYNKLLNYLLKHPEKITALSDEELPGFVKVIKYYLRRKCKKDLYFLSKYVLGYEDMTVDFHRARCKQIQKVNKYIVNRKELNEIPSNIRDRLWMWFRGCFKTTIITVSHTIQLLLLDTDLRICIASNKQDNAKIMLKAVKDHFMVNELFRFLFPEYCPTANQQGKIEWGTSTSITLPNRKSNIIKEGSVECAGVDTGLVSRHYDVLKKDDLVTDKSVTSEELIKASIDWDRLSISLFDKAELGFNDYIGTRYDERDLYGHLLNKPEGQLFRDLLPAEDKFGKPTFPERASENGLAEIREKQGEYIYSCQYLLQPIPLSERKFYAEWFQYYDELPEYYATCILVDPANSRKKKAKYTAMVVHAIDKDKKWHVVDGVFDKLSPTQRVDALFKLARKWKKTLRVVSYETIGFQESDKVYAERKMKDENFYFHITPIESQDVSKKGRIEGMVPLYEYGKILLPRRKLLYYSKYLKRMIDIVAILKYELLHFPQSEHLDFIDAQSQQLKFPNIHPVKAGKKKKKLVPGSFYWYRAKIKKYNKSPLRGTYSLQEVWDKIAV